MDDIKKSVRKYGGRVCSGFIWLSIGRVSGCCKEGSEISASIKGDELLG